MIIVRWKKSSTYKNMLAELTDDDLKRIVIVRRNVLDLGENNFHDFFLSTPFNETDNGKVDDIKIEKSFFGDIVYTFTTVKNNGVKESTFKYYIKRIDDDFALVNKVSVKNHINGQSLSSSELGDILQLLIVHSRMKIE